MFDYIIFKVPESLIICHKIMLSEKYGHFTRMRHVYEYYIKKYEKHTLFFLQMRTSCLMQTQNYLSAIKLYEIFKTNVFILKTPIGVLNVHKLSLYFSF